MNKLKLYYFKLKHVILKNKKKTNRIISWFNLIEMIVFLQKQAEFTGFDI
jgi:hypothetical protein